MSYLGKAYWLDEVYAEVKAREQKKAADDQKKQANTAKRLQKRREDWKKAFLRLGDVNSRCLSNLDPAELKEFEDCKTETLYACSTHAAKHEKNYKHLMTLSAVATFVSVDTSQRKHIKRSEPVQGLPGSCSFGVGSRVMLMKNEKSIGVSCGLFNGALGVVVGFGFMPGTAPPLQPAVVYVRFPGFTGPPWDPTDPTVVPIVPREAPCDGRCCTRLMIPLVCLR